MTENLLTVVGVGLLLVIAFDVYATVLQASGHYGPIGERLNRSVWLLGRAVAFRLPRPARHRLLNALGPILMPLLVIVFVGGLILGFGLIYYPRMPDDFFLTHESEGLDFVDSIYFSGITLITVGYGDIAPRTTAMRLTAMLESVSGLGLMSLSIAYLLTIYRALERKRAVALGFYHQAGEGADAAGYIAYHFVDGGFHGLREELRTATRDIQELLEAHVEHPVIHYFHPIEVYKGAPRMLFLLLETCTIIKTSLDPDEYSDFRTFPEVKTLDASTRQVLEEMVASLRLETGTAAHDAKRAEDHRRWARRYRRNLKRLTEAGIRIRADHAAGLGEYLAQRGEWAAKLERLSHFLGYDWDEVTGDLDPEYAADEEKPEPAAP